MSDSLRIKLNTGQSLVSSSHPHRGLAPSPKADMLLDFERSGIQLLPILGILLLQLGAD